MLRRAACAAFLLGLRSPCMCITVVRLHRPAAVGIGHWNLSPHHGRVRLLRMGGVRRTRAKHMPRGPKAKQSLGQNFLSDESLALQVAEALGDEGADGARVIELGPGQGALTRPLLRLYPRMTAVEIDVRMVELLGIELPELVVQHGDLLNLDLADLAQQRGGQLSLVSNTPFYLTSQLLFKLLGAAEHIDRVVLTMQAEVAHKILSPHGSKEYGILSVMVQLFGRAEHLFDIPPSAFQPQPKCTVSVLRLRPTAMPAHCNGLHLSAAQRSQLLALLKVTFEQRRKMLRQTLKPLLATAVSAPPAEWLTKRPEQLSPAQFVELASALFGDDVSGGGDALVAAGHSAVGWKPHKSGWEARDAAAMGSGSNAAITRDAGSDGVPAVGSR